MRIVFTVASILGALLFWETSKVEAAPFPSPTAAAITKQIVGVPVPTSCNPLEAGEAWRPEYYGLTLWFGAVTSPHNRIYLAPWVCAHLVRYGPRGGKVSQYLGAAVLIVNHEAAHAMGILNEYEAERWALGHVKSTLRRWYGWKPQSREARKAYRAALAMHLTMPPQYLNP